MATQYSNKESKISKKISGADKFQRFHSHYSVHNLFCPFIYKHKYIYTHTQTITILVVLCRCETQSLTLKDIYIVGLRTGC